MDSREEILEIDMNEIRFSHGVMRGSISLNLGKKSLLLGDNGAGKTSFVEFLKSQQKRIFQKMIPLKR